MLTVVPDEACSAVPESELPCHTANPDLWFAERPDQLGQAQRLCRTCPVRRECLTNALARREPWGVWGGEIFDRGQVIPFKRGRGRPAKARPDYQPESA
jgi:WhiB family redox-sensing transcriptional regulator